MRRAKFVIAAWAVVVAFAAGPSVGHGQGSDPQPRMTRLGVPGVANANPTMSAQGNFVAVAWGASATGGGADVYVAVSGDGGSTFGPPVRANREPGEARLGAERPPVVALVPAAGRPPDIAVLWTAGRTDTAIRVARSSDQGRSFGPPRDVQASGVRGNRGWASMAADRNGNLHVVWLDHRDAVAMSSNAAGQHEHDGIAMAQRSGLYYARLGSGAIAEQSTTPAGVLLARGVCYCCKTAVATDSGGRVTAVWRHVYAGNLRDIAAATSADGGRTFTSPQRVSEDGWAINGCPENGPSLAIDESQTAHLAWPTVVGGREPTGAVFYSSAGRGGAFAPRVRVPTLAGKDPEHVQLVRSTGGASVVSWDEVIDGKRTIVSAHVRVTGRGVEVGRPRAISTAVGRHPALAVSATGVLVAWTDGAADGPTSIAVRRISD
jgi:hypothetical protein